MGTDTVLTRSSQQSQSLRHRDLCATLTEHVWRRPGLLLGVHPPWSQSGNFMVGYSHLYYRPMSLKATRLTSIGYSEIWLLRSPLASRSPVPGCRPPMGCTSQHKDIIAVLIVCSIFISNLKDDFSVQSFFTVFSSVIRYCTLSDIRLGRPVRPSLVHSFNTFFEHIHSRCCRLRFCSSCHSLRLSLLDLPPCPTTLQSSSPPNMVSH